ncbi:MAG: spore coat protein YlbD, partial [Turicibacter sp.]
MTNCSEVREMDNQLEDFKKFVRLYPGLRDEVRSGRATWQSLYEEWYLYGEEDSQWEKYKQVNANSSNTTSSADTATQTDSSSTSTTASSTSATAASGAEMMTQAFQYLQKMDMNKVQQTMGTVQQFVKLF